jgi:hypothetical protein
MLTTQEIRKLDATRLSALVGEEDVEEPLTICTAMCSFLPTTYTEFPLCR